MTVDAAGLPSGKLPPPRSAELLWVDNHRETREKSSGKATFRSKQAWLRSKSHKLRKQAGLQRLKSSIAPFPTTGRASASKPSNTAPQSLSNPHFLILYPSLNMSILECFPSLSLNINWDVNLYLHHYEHHTSKTCFPFGHVSMALWFWQKALDHPTLIPIILSCGAFHRCTCLQASGADPQILRRSRQDALRLRADAINSIQKLLEDPSKVYSEAAVVAIARLLCLEGADANASAVETHAVGLRMIIDGLRGSDNFESQTNTIIYSCDFLKGYIMNSPPTFPVAYQWEQDVQSQIAVDSNRVCAKSALGSYFVTSPWSHTLHPSLRSSLWLCRQLALYFESTFYAQPNLSSAGLVIENSLLILSRRLMSLSGDPLLDPFQDTLRQSILVCCGLRFWKFQGMPFMVAHFERFKRTLVSSLSLIQREDPNLCFWVLFVGGLASQAFNCHAWFLFHLRETVEQLSLRDWDHARSLLEGFFFVSYPEDDPAEVFWNSVLQI